jgi:hypothetical protein
MNTENTLLEKFLKLKGYNRTTITDLIQSSPPTTRLLMQNPEDLKVSQVVKIADSTGTKFNDVAGLIFNTHNLVMVEDNLEIQQNRVINLVV